jgi:hypothetical protein
MKKTTYKTGAAECAAAIRVELKKAFPGVKFSVRSSTFSMGDSVGVSWTDGPTEPAVENVINRFQYGTFDSMTDCAGIVEGFTGPGARFVHSNRTVSDRFKAEARARIAVQHNLTADEAESDSNWTYADKLPEHMPIMIHRYLYPVDLTNGLAPQAELDAAHEAELVARAAAWEAEQAAEIADYEARELARETAEATRMIDYVNAQAARLAAETYRKNTPPVLVILPRAPAVCGASPFMFSKFSGV